MADSTSRTMDRVKSGEQLPELSIEVDVSTVVLGALATRDWRPMHHDKDFAVERNGTRHIFINTPHTNSQSAMLTPINLNGNLKNACSAGTVSYTHLTLPTNREV